jgi:hypothetical protein
MPKTRAIIAHAQFQEMLNWRSRGWRPAPLGRRCPLCRGAVWIKQWPGRARAESHRCTRCHWSQDYQL